MIAAPPDQRLAAVLSFANEARARLGMFPEPDLLGGERVNPWFCPICRTVGRNMSRRLEVEFCGTRLRVWVRGTTEMRLELAATDVVVAWSEAFDRGLVGDDLAMTRENARRP